MIAGTFILAQYVWALDAHLFAAVDKYDPGTPEAQRASEEWASDTGRSFTLLLSPLLTGVWYTALFLLLFGSRWIVGQIFPTKFASVHPQTNSETEIHKPTLKTLTNHQARDNNTIQPNDSARWRH